MGGDFLSVCPEDACMLLVGQGSSGVISATIATTGTIFRQSALIRYEVKVLVVWLLARLQGHREFLVTGVLFSSLLGVVGGGRHVARRGFISVRTVDLRITGVLLALSLEGLARQQ